MSAKFIQMHKITERTTLKVLPADTYSIEFIVDRMYNCHAKVAKSKGKKVIKDIELGVIATVIDDIVDDGSWHEIKPISFIKPTYSIAPFYDENILKKKESKFEDI